MVASSYTKGLCVAWTKCAWNCGWMACVAWESTHFLCLYLLKISCTWASQRARVQGAGQWTVIFPFVTLLSHKRSSEADMQIQYPVPRGSVLLVYSGENDSLWVHLWCRSIRKELWDIYSHQTPTRTRPAEEVCSQVTDVSREWGWEQTEHSMNAGPIFHHCHMSETKRGASNGPGLRLTETWDSRKQKQYLVNITCLVKRSWGANSLAPDSSPLVSLGAFRRAKSGVPCQTYRIRMHGTSVRPPGS